jgi:very-short-patch-repair endonuclease
MGHHPTNERFDSHEPANIVYGDLTDEPGPVMTKLATVVQCGRRLPFDQALTVADSALRNCDVLLEDLRSAAASVTGKGAPAVRGVAAEANALAANPFESALRAVALDVPGLRVVPQRPIPMGNFVIHPDLVDVDRRIVLEADSWIHHASRAGHKSDCERYNFLVLDGWLPLRYVWEQVMLHPDQVRADLCGR